MEIDLCLPPIIDRSFGDERHFNFPRTDFTRLNTTLSSVDWSSPYDSLSLDRILIGFYDLLFKCFRGRVPLVNSRLKRSDPP